MDDFAGWKVLPHVYAPAAWHLPVAVGVVAEFSFLTATFQDPASIEIHPVVEKRAGNFLLDANPSFGHTLKGPGREDEWIFAPSFCVRYTKSNRVIPHLEYYDQPTRFHHVIGGAGMRIGENLLLSLGIGAGPTPAGNQLVYASKIEYRFRKIRN
jgi:hypothetical protein